MSGRIKIKLKHSLIGEKPGHRKTVAALGLRKISDTTEKEANSAIMGMIRKVSHLIEVEEVK
ncbi:MAG: 50S ribosomal protein L30 [Spirochaetes bacterium]|nr:MAG: 50S ribosomal protein L30 [Spirochaetota bacterium]